MKDDFPTLTVTNVYVPSRWTEKGTLLSYCTKASNIPILLNIYYCILVTKMWNASRRTKVTGKEQKKIFNLKKKWKNGKQKLGMEIGLEEVLRFLLHSAKDALVNDKCVYFSLFWTKRVTSLSMSWYLVADISVCDLFHLTVCL